MSKIHIAITVFGMQLISFLFFSTLVISPINNAYADEKSALVSLPQVLIPKNMNISAYSENGKNSNYLQVYSISALPNVTSGILTTGPILEVNPSFFSETLREQESSVHALILSNTGDSSLTYSVSVTDSVSSDTRFIASRSSAVTGRPLMRSIPSNVEYVPGELIIKLKPSYSKKRMSSLFRASGFAVKRRIPELNFEVLQLPSKEEESLLKAIADVSADPGVVYAEPNYIYKAYGSPNDPSFDALWGLHNTGQTGGLIDADIDASEAWSISTGNREVVVAVIDTGVDYNHEDLAANMWINVAEIPGNRIDDDGNGYIDDIYGYDFAYNDADPMDGHYHGTHCAGTVGAAGDNGIGVVGVNHAVQVMAVKFLNDFGSGTTSDAVEAIMYAVDNGAHILSNSWGGGGRSSALEDAIVYANEHNALFVAAAGNDGRDTDIWPNYPSGYEVPNVMSIAATDHNDEMASFSNWGLTTVDLGAPGVNILSTIPDNSYDSLNGTSMATPHVSGVAALLKGYNSALGALDLKDAIMETVDSIATLDGITVTGGRLNAEKALISVPPPWINVKGELSGEIEPGTSVELTVHLYGQSVGISEADITITTNDPAHPEQVVPVELVVLPDDVAPDPVVDLHATDSTSRSVTLEWKATGDDGLTGRASGYDIRYSTAPLDEASWDSATQVEDEPAPAESGSVEAFELAGLLPETRYWIGLKVKDDADQHSALSNVIEATTAPAPVLRSDPETMPPVWLEKNDETTRVLTLHNDGGDELTFELRLVRSAPAVDIILDRQVEPIAVVKLDTPNLDTRRRESDLKPYAEYSGDHLHFGITEYGEIMPYQYPIGTEHLRQGFYGAGYTVAYRQGGTDNVVYAGYGSRSGMVPVSYEELENSPTDLGVRVTAESSDHVIQVVRTFDFDKSSKHVDITTLIKNISGTPVADVVFKSWSDWDVDGYFGSNIFDYDETYHLGYAYQSHYCGIASSREPDLRDLDGWDDYSRRLTDEDYRDGPVMMDGLEVLHFNLGDLADAASEQVETIYVSGDSLEELQGQVRFFRWLSTDVTSGTISAGESLDIALRYRPGDLEPGRYAADIIVASNDPVNPIATVSASLNICSDDTDGDGLCDDIEIRSCTDPSDDDTDDDDISDGMEDANHDGVVDPGETDPCDEDTDEDDLPDGWEVDNKLDPLDAAGENGQDGDPDNDKLNNLEEYQNGTDPIRFDTDNDDLSDFWEVENGLDPLDASGPNGRDGDFDNDGWTNYEEYILGTDTNSPSDPAPTPPEVVEVNPHDGAGLDPDSTRIANNTSFAVLIEDSDGLDITDTSSIMFTIDVGENIDEIDFDNGKDAWVRVTKLDPDETDTAVTRLWAAYHRAEDDDRANAYSFESEVTITVEAKDRRQDWMPPETFVFRIESATEHDDAQADSPDTDWITPSDPAYDAGIEVTGGDLASAMIFYDDNEPTPPTLGPTDHLPALDVTGFNAVGVSMNLQPPTVFITPVKIFIPAPLATNVDNLSIYYYDGLDWVPACDAAGNVQPDGDGWMVPDSRVNHNDTIPPTIEVQVYHFSGVQTAISDPSGDSGGGEGSESGGGGGGGGCFITAAANDYQKDIQTIFCILSALGWIVLMANTAWIQKHRPRGGKLALRRQRKRRTV